MVDLDLSLQRCHQRGFPMQIAGVCDVAYRACRYIAMSSRVVGGRFARQGIVAGSRFSATSIRVLS
eukprot:8095637-Pyramimonas_sp.AAC.1